MTATTEDNNPSISMLRLTAEHLLNSRLPGGDYEERSYRSGTMNKLEVAVGLEPTKVGFADRRLDRFGIATNENHLHPVTRIDFLKCLVHALHFRLMLCVSVEKDLNYLPASQFVMRSY